MDKLKLTQLFKECEEALLTLEGVLLWGLKDEEELENIEDPREKAEAELSRDGIILRFDYTFETAWKLMKGLNDSLGTPCFSPKECIRLATKNGLITNPNKWLEYTDNRNLIVHTYGRINAQRISGKIEEFVGDVKLLLENANKKLAGTV